MHSTWPQPVVYASDTLLRKEKFESRSSAYLGAVYKLQEGGRVLPFCMSSLASESLSYYTRSSLESINHSFAHSFARSFTRFVSGGSIIFVLPGLCVEMSY